MGPTGGQETKFCCDPTTQTANAAGGAVPSKGLRDHLKVFQLLLNCLELMQTYAFELT